MEEMVFYSEEVHEAVALYLTAHGCRVQVERQPPDYVFHKVTCPVKSCVRFGGGDQCPFYRYYLSNGTVFLEQTLRPYGTVPGHPNDYWTTLYIEERNGKHEQSTARTEGR